MSNASQNIYTYKQEKGAVTLTKSYNGPESALHFGFEHGCNRKMSPKSVFAIVSTILIARLSVTNSAAFCSTVILIGNIGPKFDLLFTAKGIPAQCHGSLNNNEKLENARHNRAKRIENVEKYSGNCATLIVNVNNHAMATAVAVQYERMGFRSKDSFLFVLRAALATGFFELKNLRGKFRSVSVTFANELDGTPVRDFIHKKSASEGPVRLAGRSLDVAAITVPPLAIFDKSSRQRPPSGCFIEAIQRAGNNFNFTLKFDYGMFRRGGQGRPMPNGTWSGVLGGLMRNEVDMTLLGHQVARYPQADHTSLLFSDSSSFLVKRPHVKVRWTALVDPLTGTVWLLSAISISLVMASTFATLKLSKGMAKNAEALYVSVMDPVSVVLDQGAKVLDGTRLLMYTWMLTCLILGTGYKDKLITFLTFPEPEQIPLELKDFNLPSFQGYRLLQDGWLISFRLNSSNDPAIMMMKDRFEFMTNSAHHGGCHTGREDSLHWLRPIHGRVHCP